jgi:hypothetical protein
VSRVPTVESLTARVSRLILYASRPLVSTSTSRQDFITTPNSSILIRHQFVLVGTAAEPHYPSLSPWHHAKQEPHRRCALSRTTRSTPPPIQAGLTCCRSVLIGTIAAPHYPLPAHGPVDIVDIAVVMLSLRGIAPPVLNSRHHNCVLHLVRALLLMYMALVDTCRPSPCPWLVDIIKYFANVASLACHLPHPFSILDFTIENHIGTCSFTHVHGI